MNVQKNILGRILIFAIVIFIVVIVIELVALFGTKAQASSATSNLSSLQTQVSDAQTTNTKLQAKYNKTYLEWRNAQGRLSLLGDGSGKVCYLTFDDGPCDDLTPKNLAILKEKGAVATWFCLGNTEEYTYIDLSLCKKIEAQGSAVGIHDWDQNDTYDFYKGTVSNYFSSDFNKVKKALETAVGHSIDIVRFAGGSTTIGYYNSKIGKSLPRAMLEKGYQYFDWNVLAGDSESSQMVNGKTPKSRIVSNVLSEAKTYAKTNSPICVLMHDNPGKTTTTEALPEIIDGLEDMGYTFKTLTKDTPGFYQLAIE